MKPFAEQISGALKIGFQDPYSEPVISIDGDTDEQGCTAVATESLDRHEAERLRDWLSQYLEDGS